MARSTRKASLNGILSKQIYELSRNDSGRGWDWGGKGEELSSRTKNSLLNKKGQYYCLLVIKKYLKESIGLLFCNDGITWWDLIKLAIFSSYKRDCNKQFCLINQHNREDRFWFDFKHQMFSILLEAGDTVLPEIHTSSPAETSNTVGKADKKLE